MHRKTTRWTLACLGLLFGCSETSTKGLNVDAIPCPLGNEGALSIAIAIDDDADAPVDVSVWNEDGELAAHLTGPDSLQLPSGRYTVSARRLLIAGELVGAAYQPQISKRGEFCVRDDTTIDVEVNFAREPGSEQLWVTQSNGAGAQVQSFGRAALQTLGLQDPEVELTTDLPNVGPLRVDAKGRLWVGSNTGKLVAFSAARLGESSDTGPDVVLEGPALCGPAVPCGPRALAFDAAGALWVATLDRVVKLAPESLESSGEPSAELTLTSPDTQSPTALAFDQDENLWIADAEGGVAEFAKEHLDGDFDGPADSVIFATQSGPVSIGLGGPEGLVFDDHDNLWVGYFAGNNLARFTPEERLSAASASDPIIPERQFVVGVEALVTDLALDEAGNLWLPGGQGALYRIDHDQLAESEPNLQALRSDRLGSVEKLTFHSVAGELFIAP